MVFVCSQGSHSSSAMLRFLLRSHGRCTIFRQMEFRSPTFVIYIPLRENRQVLHGASPSKHNNGQRQKGSTQVEEVLLPRRDDRLSQKHYSPRLFGNLEHNDCRHQEFEGPSQQNEGLVLLWPLQPVSQNRKKLWPSHRTIKHKIR